MFACVFFNCIYVMCCLAGVLNDDDDDDDDDDDYLRLSSPLSLPFPYISLLSARTYLSHDRPASASRTVEFISNCLVKFKKKYSKQLSFSQNDEVLRI